MVDSDVGDDTSGTTAACDNDGDDDAAGNEKARIYGWLLTISDMILLFIWLLVYTVVIDDDTGDVNAISTNLRHDASKELIESSTGRFGTFAFICFL